MSKLSKSKIRSVLTDIAKWLPEYPNMTKTCGHITELLSEDRNQGLEEDSEQKVEKMMEEVVIEDGEQDEVPKQLLRAVAGLKSSSGLVGEFFNPVLLLAELVGDWCKDSFVEPSSSFVHTFLDKHHGAVLLERYCEEHPSLLCSEGVAEAVVW